MKRKAGEEVQKRKGGKKVDVEEHEVWCENTSMDQVCTRCQRKTTPLRIRGEDGAELTEIEEEEVDRDDEGEDEAEEEVVMMGIWGDEEAIEAVRSEEEEEEGIGAELYC